MLKRILTLPLYSIMFIPLQKDVWKPFKFSNIPANTVEFKKNKLHIDVKRSSSGLIYSLKKPKKVKSIQISGLVKMLSPNQIRNFKFEDFVLQVGLIYEGKRGLNPIEAMFAKDWIKTIYKTLEKHQGISKVDFYGLAINPAKKGMMRENKFYSLPFKYEVVDVINSDGKFTLKKEVNDPNNKVIGIWINSDGDDFRNKFSLEVSKLELVTK